MGGARTGPPRQRWAYTTTPTPTTPIPLMPIWFPSATAKGVLGPLLARPFTLARSPPPVQHHPPTAPAMPPVAPARSCCSPPARQHRYDVISATGSCPGLALLVRLRSVPPSVSAICSSPQGDQIEKSSRSPQPCPRSPGNPRRRMSSTHRRAASFFFTRSGAQMAMSAYLHASSEPFACHVGCWHGSPSREDTCLIHLSFAPTWQGEVSRRVYSTRWPLAAHAPIPVQIVCIRPLPPWHMLWLAATASRHVPTAPSRCGLEQRGCFPPASTPAPE